MEKPKISEVAFHPIPITDKGLIGFASFLWNDTFKFNGIGVYLSPDGNDYRLLYPAVCLPHGVTLNSIYPVDKLEAKLITEAVVSKVKEVSSKRKVKKSEQHITYEPFLD